MVQQQIIAKDHDDIHCAAVYISGWEFARNTVHLYVQTTSMKCQLENQALHFLRFVEGREF